jgi:aspartate/methionine/tyrosine aminotransferase
MKPPSKSKPELNANAIQKRRDFIVESLKKAGLVVLATNATYVVTHLTNSKGNTAGAK